MNTSVRKDRCCIEFELLSYNLGKKTGNYCTVFSWNFWPSKLLHPVQLTKSCIPQRRIKRKPNWQTSFFYLRPNCSWNTQYSSAYYTSRKIWKRKKEPKKGSWSDQRVGGRCCSMNTVRIFWLWSEKIKELSKTTWIIEVPSSLKVSILGQIKGNSTLYLWKLIPKYEQVYIDSWVADPW